MVKKLFNLVNREMSGLHEAAYLLAFFSVLSQILAIFRDRILAGHFGASMTLDIYYASFRIPDLIFVITTVFVSAAAIVPFISEKMEDKIEMKRMINGIFTVFISISLLICIAVFVFAPFILKIFVPGMNSSVEFPILVLFTRILLLSPIFLGISQLLGGIVQAYRRFFIYSISPILYNVGIILGIVFLYPKFGAIGLIFGVVLGSILHLAIQIPYVFSNGLFPRPTFNINWPEIRKIIWISIPRTIALASSQISILILISIASTMMTGSITIFNFSFNMQSVPMTIIGVSYSLAAFPTLSRLFAANAREEFYKKIATSAKHIIFWSFPVMALFIILRAQIVRTILGSGEFDWQATRLTAAALAIFSISIVAQSLVLLFVRSYYSAKLTLKPMIINVSSLAFTILLALGLSYIFKTSDTFRFFFESFLRVSDIWGGEILMLPLAYSIGMIVNAFVFWIYFEKDFTIFSHEIWRPFRDSLIASLVIGYVSYVGLQIFDDLFNINTFWGIFSQGFLSGLIGILFGLITLIILGNNEIIEVWNTLNHKFWQKIRPIFSGQEEL